MPDFPGASSRGPRLGVIGSYNLRTVRKRCLVWFSASPKVGIGNGVSHELVEGSTSCAGSELGVGGVEAP